MYLWFYCILMIETAGLSDALARSLKHEMSSRWHCGLNFKMVHNYPGLSSNISSFVLYGVLMKSQAV